MGKSFSPVQKTTFTNEGKLTSFRDYGANPPGGPRHFAKSPDYHVLQIQANMYNIFYKTTILCNHPLRITSMWYAPHSSPLAHTVAIRERQANGSTELIKHDL